MGQSSYYDDDCYTSYYELSLLVYLLKTVLFYVHRSGTGDHYVRWTHDLVL